MNRKVLMVGWDAADWQVLRPLLAQGALPALARLIEGGSTGSMATLQPCLSPVLWTSIATGKAPWRHGVHGFVEPKPDRTGLRPVGSASRTCKALWNMASQAGKRVHCVGWFASHPAEHIHGVCVSDQFAVAPVTSTPQQWPLPAGSVQPESQRDRLSEFRWHPTENSAADLQPFLHDAANLDQTDPRHQRRLLFLSKTLAQCASVHATATWLLEHEPWDLMMVYYEAIDQMGHEFMPFHPPRLAGVPERDFHHYEGVMEGIYRFHDLMLARLLDLAGEDTTVILLSDHGFQSGAQRPGPVANDPKTQAAWHRPFGIVALHGPEILPGGEIHGATLTDITPTALHLLGLPVGEDMDGKVLATAFREPVKPSTIPSWDSAGPPLAESRSPEIPDESTHAAMLQQFIALGYLQPAPTVSAAVRTAENELRFNEAQANRSAGRPGPAAMILTQLAEREPGEPRYRLALADAQLALGQSAAARTALESLPVTWRQSAEVHLMEAQLLTAEGRTADAVNLLAAASRDHPRHSPLISQRGLYLLHQRRWTEAEQAFRAAHVLDVDCPFAWHGLAAALVEQDRTQEAIDAALHAVDRRPQFPEAHFVLGRALVRQGDAPRAIRALETAVKQNPAHEASHSILARLHYRLGDPHRSWLHREILRHLRERRALQAQAQAELSAIPTAPTSVQSPPPNAAQVAASANVPLPPNQEFILVSGLPRSGTSLMMQMLRAGGLEPMTDGRRVADIDNPEGYWEWEDIQKLPQEPLLLEQALGKVIKVISALLPSLPSKHQYRILFMKRPVEEVVVSQQQMLARRGTTHRTPPAQLEAELANHAREMLEVLRRNPRVRLLEIDYPALVAQPTVESARIAMFLADRLTTPERMPQVVQPALYRNQNK